MVIISQLTLTFPPNFLWGTATSAHQIEGNNTANDWWDWEAQGRVKNREISGAACDHFNRFEEDFALAENLHQNAHRFSIEWSRIEPQEGEFSDSAIYHYRQVLESLRRRKIIPMVTLFHFTLPRWVAQKGGFENKQILFWFESYVRKCVSSFGDLVPFWITLNEPMVYFYESYFVGHWPPGKKMWWRARQVIHRLIQAHGRAYEAIHEETTRNSWKTEVGLATYFRLFHPLNPASPFDRWATWIRHYLFNQLFLDAIHTGVIGFPVAFNAGEPGLKNAWDFIGLNYYTREKACFSFSELKFLFSKEVPDTGTEKNSLGWEVYPQGLYEALMSLKQFRKPVYVTENGICTENDKQREKFIVRHTVELYRALQDGADVRGYFYWSLLDNFEWIHGYGPRFGLVGVDPSDQKRIPKPSARVYAEIARKNALEVNNQ